jgi:hypothetical protein
VSHYGYDALDVAADGGAARIAEGEGVVVMMMMMRVDSFTIHSATSTSTGLLEEQCEYRRRRYGYFLCCESDREW